MFPPKYFDNFSPEGGCSKGLDAFRIFLKHGSIVSVAPRERNIVDFRVTNAQRSPQATTQHLTLRISKNNIAYTFVDKEYVP